MRIFGVVQGSRAVPELSSAVEWLVGRMVQQRKTMAVAIPELSNALEWLKNTGEDAAIWSHGNVQRHKSGSMAF